jgi:hypothetical protein
LLASKFAARFGLKLDEKSSSLFFAEFVETFPSRSVQKACPKLPGRQGRVFPVKSGTAD